MKQRVRSALVAAYLLLCILFGGSSQGVWNNLALQLLGIGLVALAALAPQPAEERGRPAFVYLLLAAGGLLVLLQLIPLPSGFWTDLPGRARLAEGLALLGQADVALPVSFGPYETVTALFAAIPGLALFIAVKLLRPSPRWLAIAIGTAMTISIALGALQVADQGGAGWRFYRYSNVGAVGVFANVNHMATLLLVSIPFGAALVVSWKGEGPGARQARWIVAVAGILLVLVGIALNGSRAALALSVPVLLASAALTPAALRWRPIALPVAVIVLVGSLFMLATGPLASVRAEADDPMTRQQIWSTTMRAVADTFPVGTGLGTFENVYVQYEDQGEVASRYVNHAHNDYLELVLELGAPGLVLILLFLLWWGLATVRIWTSQLSTPFERAATIASAAILAHSAVDFPLRTAAIAAVFGVAIALMAQPIRSRERSSASERRPARHVQLG